MRFCFVVKLWCTSTLDVQPPLVEHCPDDIRRTSSERFVNITWKAPDFYDRFGHNVLISSNYPRHGSSFFWGHYTVEYSALKPFNGLRTNCTFNITVRRKLYIQCLRGNMFHVFVFKFLINSVIIEYIELWIKENMWWSDKYGFFCMHVVDTVSWCVLKIALALHRVIDIL